MTSGVFLDTNVIVYEMDHDDARRHRQAAAVVRRLGRGRSCLSQQVLSEFANVLVHPRKLNLPATEAALAIRRLASVVSVLPVTTRVVISALGAADRWGLHFYDAQIWATAALNNVPVVLSEDFEHGLQLGPVRFLDPFDEGFDVAELDV